MNRLRAQLISVVTLAFAPVAPALAQGTLTASISGTVADGGGGVVVGAAVVVSNGAGASFHVVTNGEGAFRIPALTPDTYQVTVTQAGFKTSVTDGVRLISGNPVNIRVALDVGETSETVAVTSGADLVNLETATVSSTLGADQLNAMPTYTRNALNAITFMPGVNVAGITRNGTVNGLAACFTNITWDGVSDVDNFGKSTTGLFAQITPRLDAVDAVTVVSAVAGANLGGSGAVTVTFTTRSGTNMLGGSAYAYWRDPRFNSNYWFNERNGLPKNDVKLYQFGARAGGPIVVPGLYDGTGRAFFFVHYEQVRFPNSLTRMRRTFHPDTLNGDFRYNVGTETRSVNLMALAAANGQISAYDPQVRAMLGFIEAATQTTGTMSTTADPLLNTYAWLPPGKLFEHQPTVRLDFNATSQHRLSGSATVVLQERTPDYLNALDPRFPGAPNFTIFKSQRPLYSISLRSVLSSNIVNELRGGLLYPHGRSDFGRPTDPSSNKASFADMGGYAVVLPLTAANWWTDNNPNSRASPVYSVENSLNWMRGRHGFNVGGAVLRVTTGGSAQRIVPTINLGFNSANDPANAMFTTTNFPGASTAQLNSARAVYAMLTGRVLSVNGQAALDPATNRYVAFGPQRTEGRMDVYSLHGQDSWRIGPTITLKAGLRWDLQRPFVSGNDTMSAVAFSSVCGMSGPGDGSTFNKCAFASRRNVGVTPEFLQLTRHTLGYETDWNNVAPSVSLAWQPNVQTGWLRAVLGAPEQATLRGGYSVSYDRQGLGMFIGTYGDNPGNTLALSRSAATGDLVRPGESWPVLYSEKSRLYDAAFPASPTYPIAVRPGRADSINAFAPDIAIASARTFTVGFQRSIARDMAVDIRYVGTRGADLWSMLDYNMRDLEDNGFFNEFMLAVGNLRVNNASGDATRIGSFRYFGPGTGTSPLPIYLAYLNRRTDATNPAAYTGADWRNTAITQDLIFVNPSPSNSAADLDGDATRRANALAAGLPANFFVLNPAAGAVNVVDSNGSSGYDALQIDLRRRFSSGFSASLNYQYARERGSAFQGFKYGFVTVPGQQGMGMGAAPPTVRHAIKMLWDWQIPVGRDQRFAANLNPWLDGLLGGWSFRGVGRVQAVMSDFGNVRLEGMTAKDLQDMFKFDIRIDPSSGLRTVYMLPDDVILNTRRAFSLDPTTRDGYSTTLGAPTGRFIAPANSAGCVQVKAGDCAARTLLIRAPWFTRFDMGLSKRVPLGGSTNIEFAVEVLNVFDNINFNPIADPGSAATIFQTSTAYRDPSNTYDPGGRLGQLMFRFNW
jgi:hypothetical protein